MALQPSSKPSLQPSKPSLQPSSKPSFHPSSIPSLSLQPSLRPSSQPTLMCQQENCEDCKTSCNKLSTTEFTIEQNMCMCKQARCCVWGDGECHPIVECCPSQ